MVLYFFPALSDLHETTNRTTLLRRGWEFSTPLEEKETSSETTGQLKMHSETFVEFQPVVLKVVPASQNVSNCVLRHPFCGLCYDTNPVC